MQNYYGLITFFQWKNWELHFGITSVFGAKGLLMTLGPVNILIIHAKKAQP
jgi:hypothetical protein